HCPLGLELTRLEAELKKGHRQRLPARSSQRLEEQVVTAGFDYNFERGSRGITIPPLGFLDGIHELLARSELRKIFFEQTGERDRSRRLRERGDGRERDER